jgi:uncharacterized protein (DUF952 family)
MRVQVYKIIDREVWGKAIAAGVFHGASIDLADGYIHLSDAQQAEETAKRHFAGQANLLLVAFDAESFGETLKWEVSRAGALFPHVYGSIDPRLALWAKDLPLLDAGHEFPEGWRA